MEKGRAIVLNLEPLGYSDKAKTIWENKGYSYEETTWSDLDSYPNSDEVEVLIVRLAKYVDSKDLQKFPNLKYLVSATTGHDHIDTSTLDDRGIELKSLREHKDFLKTIPSTSEHTWALLMALLRRIPQATEHVKKGGWDRDEYRSYQLKDKTIGLVGFGRVAHKVAKYAAAFDMTVLFYDPFVSDGQGIATKVSSLDELVAQADIVSLHVHLTEETENLVNSDLLKNFKKGALLINTSRGKIVDEAATAEALGSGQLRGVATDVLATELNNGSAGPLHDALKKGENVIITPHIAGATWDAMWSCEEFIANTMQPC